MLACLSIAETPKPAPPKPKGIGRVKTGVALISPWDETA